MVGTGRGAQIGVLIKGPEVLESTRRIDTVVLDKTGTVTSGVMQVVEITGDADAVLALGAAVERASEHPIAKAIVRRAAELDLEVLPVDDFVNEPGVGAHGTVGGAAVSVRRTASERPASADMASARTIVDVVRDGETIGTMALADTVKASSATGVRQLRGLDLRVMLLTGDNRATAQAVAGEVGIDPSDVFADVLPAQKLAVIRDLQAQGRVVAMVGDGVNDAAALAQADLGIAMGTGTDVAIEASDLTLVRDELPAVVDAVRLSRRTLRTITTNLFWAFAYNVAAIPLAAAGLLSPVVASAAMAMSSVFVLTNSLRLRRFQPVGA
jgi:Cu+-exporting ATPase